MTFNSTKTTTERFSKLSFQNFTSSVHRWTICNTFHTSSAEILSPACSSKSFNHTNSDFFILYSRARCAVQLRNGSHVWQWWFSSPVYYAFLCRYVCVCMYVCAWVCVCAFVLFFNKENKKKNLFLDRHVIFSETNTSTNNINIQKHGFYIRIGVKVRQSMYLVMILNINTKLQQNKVTINYNLPYQESSDQYNEVPHCWLVIRLRHLLWFIQYIYSVNAAL